MGAGVDVFFVGGSGVEAVVRLEKSVADAGVFRIVIGEFRYRQQPSPVVLLIVDEDPEIGLHRVVLPLRLAICLRVEGS